MCVRNWRYRDRERKDRRSYNIDDGVGALGLSAPMSIEEELRFQLNLRQSETKDSMQSTEFHGLKVLSIICKHMRILWTAEPLKITMVSPYSSPALLKNLASTPTNCTIKGIKIITLHVCARESWSYRDREIIISTTVDQSALMRIVDEPRVELNQCQSQQTNKIQCGPYTFVN